MSTPNSHTDTRNRYRRRRLADQIANQLHTARLLDERPRMIERHRVPLAELPELDDILTAAPTIAAAGDPDLIRVAYTPSAALAVIRLHGPHWSLLLDLSFHRRSDRVHCATRACDPSVAHLRCVDGLRRVVAPDGASRT